MFGWGAGIGEFLLLLLLLSSLLFFSLMLLLLFVSCSTIYLIVYYLPKLQALSLSLYLSFYFHQLYL